MTNSGPEPTGGKETPWIPLALVIEIAAACIALLMPITPAGTGSPWSPAHLLSAEPSYAGEVVAWLLFTNGLILIAGASAWLARRFSTRRDGES